MTVVIGMLTSKFVLMASDGYAMLQKDATSPVIKEDFYSKISIIGKGRYIIGSAGSHELAFNVNDHIKMTSNDLTEANLLKSLRARIQIMNNNKEGKKTSVLLGYLKDTVPQLHIFQWDGKYKKEQAIAALGSGADEAMNYLNSIFDNKWDLSQSIEHLIEAIYHAAKSPTVNFVPMLAYIGPYGFQDLSAVTISLFKEFKSKIKNKLSTLHLLKTTSK